MISLFPSSDHILRSFFSSASYPLLFLSFGFMRPRNNSINSLSEWMHDYVVIHPFQTETIIQLIIRNKYRTTCKDYALMLQSLFSLCSFHLISQEPMWSLLLVAAEYLYTLLEQDAIKLYTGDEYYSVLKPLLARLQETLSVIPPSEKSIELNLRFVESPSSSSQITGMIHRREYLEYTYTATNSLYKQIIFHFITSYIYLLYIITLFQLKPTL